MLYYRRFAQLCLLVGVLLLQASDGVGNDADIKGFVSQLKKNNLEEKRKASEQICEHAKNGEGDFSGHVPVLIEALKDKDPIVRGEIAEALGYIGLEA